MILAIDPGTTQSAFCWYERGATPKAGILSNDEMISVITDCGYPTLNVVIEMIASYGMAVGKEVFETVRWVGRFQQAHIYPEQVNFVYRKEVKMHLCHSMKAKDANIRQALIDKIGPQGTKKAPGPTYGLAKDMWAALAVAVTFDELKRARA